MSLAAFMAPALSQAPPSNWFDPLLYAWAAVGLWGRIAAIAVAVAIALYVVVRLLGALGRRGRRALLWGMAGFGLLAFLGFGIWSSLRPEPSGATFSVWDQVINIGAAVGATLFVVGMIGLLLPWAFDALERVGFVPLVSVRHVRASKSGFLTVISLLSISGVAVSSFALCAVISIMGGFGADLKRKILGNNAHVKVEAQSAGGFQRWHSALDSVRTTRGVYAATPVVGGEAMASSSSNTAGVLVRGIDPETIGQVIDLVENIEVGRFSYLTEPRALVELPADEPIGLGTGGQVYLQGPRRELRRDVDSDVARAVIPDETYPGLVIGRELAKSLHVFVGDEVTLVSPFGELGPMGVLPRSRKFRVAAIFYSGMYEYDASHAYMLLDRAQEFLDLDGRTTGIDVKLEVADRVEQAASAIAASLSRPDLRIRHWKELNKNLFSALKLEKIATFIILSIAITVASFCIICTLLLMVTEKSKEIAILKAQGASDRVILRVFMTEGMLIGGIGTLFGVITAWVSMKGLQHFGVNLDPDVYYVDRLPILVDWIDYTLVALASFAITTLGTLYPARAASRLRPVEGIRYE